MIEYLVNSGLLQTLIILNFYCLIRGVMYHE